MRFFGTDFNLVLGAWRVRVSVAVEDDEDEPAVALKGTRVRSFLRG